MYTILQDAIVLWNIEFQLTRRCYKLKTLEITLTRRCCSVKRWHHFFRTTLFCSALKSLLRNGQSLSSWHMTNFSNKMTLRCGILHNNSTWKSGSERRICPLKLETTFKGTVSKSKAFSDMNCWFGTKESTTNLFYIFWYSVQFFPCHLLDEQLCNFMLTQSLLRAKCFSPRHAKSLH